MKNLLIIILLLLSLGSFAQVEDKNKVMSAVICECLENTKAASLKENFQETYKECLKGAVLAGMLSQINTQRDTTITINPEAGIERIDQSDMEATMLLLQKNCDIYNTYTTAILPLDSLVPDVSSEACECVGRISTSISLEEKNLLIKECTTNAIVTSISSKKANLSTVGQMKSFYKMVSDHLVENCAAIEKVTFSNDEEKLNSYSTNEKAMEFYLKGIDFMEAKDYKKAIKFYEKAVDIDSKFVFAWDNLGRSYRLINKYDKAIEAYKKSYAVDSLNPTSLMNMAVAYNYKKDFESAIFWYQKLLEINPKDPEGHYGLALIFMNQKRIEESLQKAIDARALYIESGSPYTADAEKLMRYLYDMFAEENKQERFKKICSDNNINLD
jgi:tetratricopeptide (TPR) repeat protein